MYDNQKMASCHFSLFFQENCSLLVTNEVLMEKPVITGSHLIFSKNKESFLNYHGRKRIIISPSPVAPQAPTSSSPYEEDPGIGPSPTLE